MLHFLTDPAADYLAVVTELLQQTQLLDSDPGKDLWQQPVEPRTLMLRSLCGLADAERLVWVVRQLRCVNIDTSFLDCAVKGLMLETLMQLQWTPPAWHVLLHLKDEGVLPGDTVQKLLPVTDPHVLAEMQLLETDAARTKTSNRSPGSLSWSDQQYPFFQFIGNHYNCFRCAANAQCQVQGCTRRPMDCFCPNFKIRGKPFRYDWKHPVIDGRILHVCGRCAKRGMYYKTETAVNHERAVAKWIGKGRRGRRPKPHAFNAVHLEDGRSFQVRKMEDDNSWWLCEVSELLEVIRFVRQVKE